MTAGTSLTPRQQAAARLIGMLISVALALAALEAGARIVFGRSDRIEAARRDARDSMAMPDERTIYRLRPGWESDYRQSEFATHVRINSRGLRDDETPYDRPAGVFRIALIGDSFIAALEVDRGETLADRLEAALNHDPRTAGSGLRYEVLNAGVPGYNTLNEYLLLRHEILRYQPDLVLAAFFMNDVEGLIDEGREVEGQVTTVAAGDDGHIRLDADGEPALITLPAADAAPPEASGPLDAWLTGHSKLYAVLRPTGERFGPLARRAGNLIRRQDAPVFNEEAYAVNPGHPGAAARLTALQDLTALMRDRVAEQGGALAAFVIPDSSQVYPERPRRYYVGFDLLADYWDVERLDREMAAFYRAEGIPYLLLSGPLGEAAASGGDLLYFQFDRHWTPAGHAAAADAVLEWLIAEGLVPAG